MVLPSVAGFLVSGAALPLGALPLETEPAGELAELEPVSEEAVDDASDEAADVAEDSVGDSAELLEDEGDELLALLVELPQAATVTRSVAALTAANVRDAVKRIWWFLSGVGSAGFRPVEVQALPPR